MNFIAVDDEKFELYYLEKTLQKAIGNCNLMCFTNPYKALKHISISPVDVIFLDIALGNINGLLLAEQFKAIQPDVHIIFITNHECYVSEKIRPHDIGYLLKPVTAEGIFRELSFLYEQIKTNLYVQAKVSSNFSQFYRETASKFQIFCFGEFSIYYNQLPIHLSCKKAYELIAYLIVHHGHPINKWELSSRLWEEAEPVHARDRLYKVLKAIKKVEEQIGCSLIEINGQKVFLKTNHIQCTLWKFEELYQNKSISNFEKAEKLFKFTLFGGEAYSWILEEEGRYEFMYLEILEFLLDYYKTKKVSDKVGYYQKQLKIIETDD